MTSEAFYLKNLKEIIDFYLKRLENKEEEFIKRIRASESVEELLKIKEEVLDETESMFKGTTFHEVVVESYSRDLKRLYKKVLLKEIFKKLDELMGEKAIEGYSLFTIE